MIDIYDSETCVKVYRLLTKKCQALDKFIDNHAFYFGPYTEEYGAVDVYNSIIELIGRKNQLINLKLIIDKSFENLSDNDKKILFLKMNYTLTNAEMGGILDIKERTVFRRLETAYDNLAKALNQSKYSKKLELILDSEDWLAKIKDNVKEKRLAYREKAC